MPATISSPGPTRTGPPPTLVTQFSQPDECKSLFRFASNSTSSITYTNQPPEILISITSTSDTANEHFSSCQPSGWDSSNFTFSPGLCPSGWVYNALGASLSSTATVTHAYCCASGYTLLGFGDRRRCDTDSDLGNDVMRTLVHDAWYVEWQASDALAVKLPEVPVGSSVKTWIPGETATPISPDALVRDNDLDSTRIAIVATVIPVVVVAFLVAASIFCIRKNRKLKRQEQQ